MATAKLTRGARRDVVATACIVLGAMLGVAVLGTPRGELDPGECGPILDRYVELRMHAAYEKVPASLLEEKQTASKERATLALGECARKLTRERAECAMKAPSADELERCFP
jgi:hypothetical protein